MRQFGNNNFAQQARHRQQQQQQRQRMGAAWMQQKRLAEERQRNLANAVNIQSPPEHVAYRPAGSPRSGWAPSAAEPVRPTVSFGQIVKTIVWGMILIPAALLGFAAFIGFAFQGAGGAFPFFAVCSLVLMVGGYHLRNIWSGGKPGPFVRGGITGEVRGLQKGMEPLGNRNMEVLSFRLENYDRRGNRLAPIPVQMRGLKFIGTLHEGDHVVIKGRRPGHGTLQVKKLYNATTRTTVRAKKPSMWFLDLIFFAIAIGAFATICAAINAGMSSF